LTGLGHSSTGERMRLPLKILLLAFAAAGIPAAAAAASLQVAPLLVDVTAPGAASSLTLRNEGPKPINAQIRVYRWTQVDGDDVLEPTNAVVASPPSAALASRADYTVRLVRTARQGVAGEEAYRLLVDELPDASREKSGTVAMVLRHSVPVFFSPAEPEPPRLTWYYQVEGGRLYVTLVNEGGRRIRISKLKVTDGRNTVNFGDGLVGYALAGSSVTWVRPARSFGSGKVTVSAQGDLGSINATASVPDR
jgi:fimbrial chaperone protein